MPREAQDRVRQFMLKVGDEVHFAPTLVSVASATRRHDLIDEELDEYLAAVIEGDLEKVADAGGDLLYTVLGLFNLHGLDAAAVFDAIHESNMTKDPGGEPRKLAVKGPGYRPPELKRLVGKLGPVKPAPRFHLGDDDDEPAYGHGV